MCDREAIHLDYISMKTYFSFIKFIVSSRRQYKTILLWPEDQPYSISLIYRHVPCQFPATVQDGIHQSDKTINFLTVSRAICIGAYLRLSATILQRSLAEDATGVIYKYIYTPSKVVVG